MDPKTYFLRRDFTDVATNLHRCFDESFIALIYVRQLVELINVEWKKNHHDN